MRTKLILTFVLAAATTACSAAPTDHATTSEVTSASSEGLVATGLTHLDRLTLPTGSVLDLYSDPAVGDTFLFEHGDATHPPSKINWSRLSLTQAFQLAAPGAQVPPGIIAADARVRSAQDASAPAGHAATFYTQAPAADAGSMPTGKPSITVQSTPYPSGDANTFCTPAWAYTNLWPIQAACAYPNGGMSWHWCAYNLNGGSYQSGERNGVVWYDEGAACAQYAFATELVVYRSDSGTGVNWFPPISGGWITYWHSAATNIFGQITYSLLETLNEPQGLMQWGGGQLY